MEKIDPDTITPDKLSGMTSGGSFQISIFGIIIIAVCAVVVVIAVVVIAITLSKKKKDE